MREKGHLPLKASVGRFLRTGNLGAFRLGLRARDVISFLGEPWNATTGLPIDIWQFGDFEVLIQDSLIVSMELVLGAHPANLPPVFSIEDLHEWSGRPAKTAEEWLTKTGLAITKRHAVGESARWSISSGTALTLMNDAVDSVSALDPRVGGD